MNDSQVLNDVSITDVTLDRMKWNEDHKWSAGNDFKGGSRGLSLDIFLAFCWRN